MSILDRLPGVAADAREAWEHGTIPADLQFDVVMDRYEGVRPAVCAELSAGSRAESGRIITGDNLRVAKTLFAAVSAGTQDAPSLIYMDPPFFTREKYKQKIKIQGTARGDVTLPVHAFSDSWAIAPGSAGTEGKGGEKPVNGFDEAFARYLTMLTVRIIAARELLAEDGSLWIHLDHHAAHYVKALADHVFGGAEHMLNEVVWHYSSGGATKKHFARKHDTLLFYAKKPKRHSFYPLREKSYNREGRPYHFKGVKEYRDDVGWYTLVNMKDVWRVDMVGRTSGERTGYATQKPEALLERVVSSCTAPGDLCLDMFGGSGTLAAVCEQAGRRWISIDSSPLASLHAERRMAGLGAAFEILRGTHTVADGLPADRPPLVGLEVLTEDSADPGTLIMTISPGSYSLPEDALDVNIGRAAALIGMTRKSPQLFIAGMSAEVCPDAGAGNGHADGAGGEIDAREADMPAGGLFCPQYAVYGGNCLRFPARRAGAGVVRIRVVDVFGNAEIREVRIPGQA